MSKPSAAAEAKPSSWTPRIFARLPVHLRPDAAPVTGLALAAAAALLVDVFARAEHEMLALAEGRLLAAQIGLVLASIGWLSRSTWPRLAGLAAVFATLALPALPTRAAIVGLLLLLGWLMAAAPLALRRKPPTVVELFFAGLGLQVLARHDLLLRPWGLRSAALVLMPILAAAALAVLARRFGSERALLAGAAVALLAPGFNVNAVLLLLAAAAGVYAGEEERPPLARAAAAAFLLLPLLLRWPTGLLTSAVGATLLVEAIAPRRVVLPAFLAAVVGSFSVGRPLGAPLDAFLLASALLPAALAAAGDERRRVTAGVFLVFAAAWLAKDSEFWAAGVVLLALSVPCERPVGQLQRPYFLAWTGGALLLASFPWLRPEPCEILAAALLPSPPYLFVAALLLVVLPGLLAERYAASLEKLPPAARDWPRAVCGLGLLVVALAALPSAGVSLLAGQPQSLVEARPLLRLPMVAFPFREVIVDSQLFHGAELPPGQEVAALHFLGEGGDELLVLPLRAGDDTADWAAARADLERRPDFRAPSPWLSQVAPDGSFFSGRFRRRFVLPQPIAAASVEVRRAAGLPGPTQIALHELELRP